TGRRTAAGSRGWNPTSATVSCACGARPSPSRWIGSTRTCAESVPAEELLDLGQVGLGRSLLTAAEPEAGTGRVGGGRGESGVLGCALGRVARTRAALALGALLAALGRCSGLAHRAHSGDLRRAAARDGLHHLRRLLEALHELIDIRDRHARSLGDAQAAR